ncbi:MAG: FAD synthase [Candidatus Falkowbacteria bacterium]|nr:FAD synthase [Candidatus Falkowbacteria bacterium]
MRAICFGTFDYLHPGHLNYFKQASKFGEELIIIIARDENVHKNKGRYPTQPEKIRLEAVRRALKSKNYSAQAFLGNKVNPWLVLKRFKPDFICLGYDQKVDLSKLNNEIRRFRLFCKVKRLRPYRAAKYKSSLIKARMFQSN